MERKITRTIKTTTVTALCVNVDTETTFRETYVVSGHNTNESDIILEIREKNPGSIIPVKVISTTPHESIYCMTETEFMTYGHVIPQKGGED